MTTLDQPRATASHRLPRRRFSLTTASADDRTAIYRIRHAVYATELGQHPENADGSLRDALDESNEYIVVKRKDELAGFVSLTPPGHGRYSIDKYLSRNELPFGCDEGLYEVRLLTVTPRWRASPVAALLMYAAFRWIEAHGGTRIMAIGRREVLPLYRRIGFQSLGRTIRSGAVEFELMTVEVTHGRERHDRGGAQHRRLASRVDWRLDVPWNEPVRCFHGGTFFRAIGEGFEQLQRRHDVINADVLDAWFPPAPRVLEQLREHLDWIARTSPPTHCEGMVRAISLARGVPAECIVPGGGSSDLIYLAFREWLTSASRALILDPTYGEYAHVLEQVVGCRVDHLILDRRMAYRLDPQRLEEQLRREYDLVVLVNPNNPTGVHVDRTDLESVLRRAPARTRFWIDEAYVDYVGPEQSLEQFAAASDNVVVSKSMSKVYALSGFRAAYLCGPAPIAAQLLHLSPPWAVSLPGQIAAVAALGSPDYYHERYRQTQELRQQLAAGLQTIADLDVQPGVASFLLCRLRGKGMRAAELIARCREGALFLRDVGSMTIRPDRKAFRVAVKDEETNERMVDIVKKAIAEMRRSGRT